MEETHLDIFFFCMKWEEVHPPHSPDQTAPLKCGDLRDTRAPMRPMASVVKQLSLASHGVRVRCPTDARKLRRCYGARLPPKV
jgi:hypothetical protein